MTHSDEVSELFAVCMKGRWSIARRVSAASYGENTGEEVWSEQGTTAWVGLVGKEDASISLSRRSASNTAGGEDVSGEQVLNVAHRIQSIMSEKLTVDEGDIVGVGPASYKIARLFKPAPTIQAGGDEPVAWGLLDANGVVIDANVMKSQFEYLNTPDRVIPLRPATPVSAEVTVTDEMVERAVSSAEIEWEIHSDNDRAPRDFWHARIVWRGFASEWAQWGDLGDYRNPVPVEQKQTVEDGLRADLRAALATLDRGRG